MSAATHAHLLSLEDWSQEEILGLLNLAASTKADPAAYARSAAGRVLFMIFEKPSLRTRVSFETGMARLGGHAINYDTTSSPMGKGKETLEDTIQVVSRYADLIVARLFKHSDLLTMARTATVPVINGLTDYSHPCQILADLLTIREKKGKVEGVRMAYLGDSNNNVTHSLMYGCAIMGMHLSVACPDDPDYAPLPEVIARTQGLCAVSGGSFRLVHDTSAAEDVDAVYTDSWMSYHISPSEMDSRTAMLQPYQVNAAVMAKAKSDAIFMNCLPALRGAEQTAEVIDGPQSVVFDQAENRLHAQNAVMLYLLGQAT